VANGRVDRGRALGFRAHETTFTELPPQGALLVGFDLGLGRFVNIECIYAIRPVYLTEAGETYFQDYGLFNDRPTGKRKSKVLRTVRLRAQPGYAIGGLTVRHGLHINGLSATYMRILGRGLDPTQTYVSEWVGDRTGGQEATISGGGALAVGVHGAHDQDHVQALGLMYTTGLPRQVATATPPAPKRAADPVPEVAKLAPPKPAAAPPTPAPKAEAPAAPAPAEEPAADEAKAEAPAVSPRPAKAARATAGGFYWLPVAIFAALAVPLSLLLLVTGRNQTRTPGPRVDEGKPRRTRRTGRAVPPPLPARDDFDDDEPRPIGARPER
jgi:hypothetical protein